MVFVLQRARPRRAKFPISAYEHSSPPPLPLAGVRRGMGRWSRRRLNGTQREGEIEQLPSSASVERPVQWPRARLDRTDMDLESPPFPPCRFPCDDQSRTSVHEWERLDRPASGGRGRSKLDRSSQAGRCPSARVVVRNLADEPMTLAVRCRLAGMPS